MAKKSDTKPTQQFVEIEGVRDGVLTLKNGGLRRILMVNGVNFDLKSEEEQNLIIFSYQNFINGLDFSVQTLVHSRKLNIDTYLGKLDDRRSQEDNELLRNQIGEYQQFIRSFVNENAIMEKTFFVVVSFDGIQIGEVGQKLSEKLLSFLPFKKTAAKKNEAAEAAKAQKEQSRVHNIEQLDQRVNQVIAGLRQIGLNVAQLNDEQIIELFYNLYNPKTVEKETLEIARR
ncbi:MAG: hypothetical protein Q8O87_03170 [bacterium]|nr:hypothetical protein [bacterium]